MVSLVEPWPRHLDSAVVTCSLSTVVAHRLRVCSVVWDLPGPGVNLSLLPAGDPYPLCLGKSSSFFSSLNLFIPFSFSYLVFKIIPDLFNLLALFLISLLNDRKKTTIQLTHEQQLILSHKMEPLLSRW